MKPLVSVLAIGYGRQLFVTDNPERQRLLACSKKVAVHHLIIFTHEHDGCVPQQVGNFFLHPTNSKSKWHMLFDAYRIGKQILTQKGEWVVSAQDPFETSVVGFWLARRCQVPLNIQEHGDFFTTKYWRQDQPLNRLRYIFGKWVLKRATSVRVVSKRILATVVQSGVSKDRVLYLPVRSDSIATTTSARESMPGQPLTILGMGRFVSQKNFPLLIRAFATVEKKTPHATLVLVGRGERESQLRALVSALGLTAKVKFVPWTDNPGQLMATADIFALSSDWEGWARVLVEAMAVGVPIVTTAVGCAGEVVVDNVHGFVVPVRDEQAFAHKLCVLASDAQLRTTFGQNARRDVPATHQSIEAYANEWATIMERTRALYK